jgi:hypothetical protein
VTELPQDIKFYFFEVMIGNTPIGDFEKWIYANEELELLIGPEDYLDLISLNYKANGAKYELYQLLSRQIALGEFEKYKLLKLLNQAKQKDEDLANTLVQFYDLYCDGYYFLRYIGLHYGLAVEIEGKDFWSAEMVEEHKKLLRSFSPELDNQLQRIIDWLTSDKIILTGTKDELGRFEYHDFRTDEEKKLTEWEYHPKKKKWWHIW